jgi:hypothetical protein
MTNDVLEFEADTPALARQAARAKTPPGQCIVSAEVLCDGKSGARKARIRVRMGPVPERGRCQNCGRPNSPADRSTNTVNFFCSPNCRSVYLQKRTLGMVFGPSAQVLEPSPGGRSAALASADQARAYCWVCGAELGVAAYECAACGADQWIFP